MFMNDLLYKVDAEKRKRERMKAVHHIAAGMSIIIVAGVCVATGILFTTKYGREMRDKLKNKAIDTMESVKHVVIRSADAVAASAEHTADKVSSVFEAAQGKAEDIKEDFREGGGEIVKDVKETVENIATDFYE